MTPLRITLMFVTKTAKKLGEYTKSFCRIIFHIFLTDVTKLGKKDTHCSSRIITLQVYPRQHRLKHHDPEQPSRARVIRNNCL